MNRKLTAHLIAVFLFAALFIFCYWVGLPTDFNADHITTNLRGAEAASYRDLIKLTLDPLTPAWFYPAEGLMEYLRPLQFLWMKVYFQFFQSSLIPFHVTAAIGLGLLSALLVYLIYYWTGSLLFGWLAVCLYACFPSNYYMLTSTFSGDFQFYVSLLSLSALLLCCRLSFGTFRKPAAFFAAFALWIIAIWIAIKLKSSEKVIPFVCLAFLVWRFHFIRNRIGWLRLGILFAGILAMMLLVVPVKPFKAWVDQYQIHAASRSLATRVPQTAEAVTQKDKTTLAFNWQNMLARTFYVPGGEFPLTTVLRRKIPQSFTENYGFFLGWFFWLSLVLTPLMLARARPAVPDGSTVKPDWEIYRHDFWMIFIWFAATIAGFANGLSVYDTRFLNFAYVPSILLLFMAAGILEGRIFTAPGRRFFLRLALTVLIVYTALTNLAFYTALVLHYGGLQAAQVRAESDIFKAVYGEAPRGWQLYEKHHAIESSRIVIDWYELPQNWLDEAREKTNQEKEIFFYTRTAESPRLEQLRNAGLQPVLWKRYDFLDADPAIFKIFKQLFHWADTALGPAAGRRFEVLVYKIQQAA